jgi:D-xylose transport system permease protein
VSTTPVTSPEEEALQAPHESLLKARIKYYRQGDTGMVPIIIGMVILGAYFQFRSSAFLSSGNLTNLFINSCPYILLGMAEIWLLLLGDIDLSLGWVTAVGAAIAVILMDTQYHWPAYFALPLAVLATTAIGALQGLITISLKVPSFIVTLAGSLFWEGVAIYLIDANNAGGTVPTTGGAIHDIVNRNLTPLWTWVFSLAVAGGMALLIWSKDRTRRNSGLESVPFFETVIKMVAVLGLSIGLVLIFNTNRGYKTAFIHLKIEGMPIAVPLVVIVLALFSFILFKTKAGRYLYAIGGNVEAARRAGVAVNRYRLLAFAMTGFTAGIAGLVYASTLGGISDGIAGGQLVLYGVAAAVIGGTSLYGGRGKMIHALIGGLVIGVIYNGLALIQTTASVEYMATGLVLLAAIAIDSLARRGAAAAGR